MIRQFGQNKNNGAGWLDRDRVQRFLARHAAPAYLGIGLVAAAIMSTMQNVVTYKESYPAWVSWLAGWAITFGLFALAQAKGKTRRHYYLQIFLVVVSMLLTVFAVDIREQYAADARVAENTRLQEMRTDKAFWQDQRKTAAADYSRLTASRDWVNAKRNYVVMCSADTMVKTLDVALAQLEGDLNVLGSPRKQAVLRTAAVILGPWILDVKRARDFVFLVVNALQSVIFDFLTAFFAVLFFASCGAASMVDLGRAERDLSKKVLRETTGLIPRGVVKVFGSKVARALRLLPADPVVQQAVGDQPLSMSLREINSTERVVTFQGSKSEVMQQVIALTARNIERAGGVVTAPAVTRELPKTLEGTGISPIKPRQVRNYLKDMNLNTPRIMGA